jgi:hypothetical protein
MHAGMDDVIGSSSSSSNSGRKTPWSVKHRGHERGCGGNKQTLRQQVWQEVQHLRQSTQQLLTADPASGAPAAAALDGTLADAVDHATSPSAAGSGIIQCYGSTNCAGSMLEVSTTVESSAALVGAAQQNGSRDLIIISKTNTDPGSTSSTTNSTTSRFQHSQQSTGQPLNHHAADFTGPQLGRGAGRIQADPVGSSSAPPAVIAGPSLSAQRQIQQWQQEDELQQVMVMAACKALGNPAAAEQYAAALPETVTAVNLSASGKFACCEMSACSAEYTHTHTALSTFNCSLHVLFCCQCTVCTVNISILLLVRAFIISVCSSAQPTACPSAVLRLLLSGSGQFKVVTVTRWLQGGSVTPVCSAALGMYHLLPMPCAGLSLLPPLDHLWQCERLAASFNHISSLHNLIPSSTGTGPAAGQIAQLARHSNNDADDAACSCHSTTRPGQQMMAQVALLAPLAAVSGLPTSLVCLGMAHNQVQAIPMGLPAALPRLTELDLSYNK